jgi:LCP family protein required for cell wall assembly
VVAGGPRGPGGRPPGRGGPHGPRSAPRRWGRALAWIATIVSALIFIGSGTGYALFRKYDGNINRLAHVLSLPGHHKPASSTKAQNFLLVGSDSRAGTGDQYQGTGATYVTGARSDTVILLHIPKDGSRATLVSFPRDSWVEIPAWTSPSGHSYPVHMDKLNSAFAEGNLPAGNPALLVATIEDLSNLRIDHYVQIDFAGFKNMVQALGGVTICTPIPLHDHFSGIDLSAGTHTLNGDQALAFVRQRHGLPQGDIDRIAHQQQFIGAVFRKVFTAGTLLNPFKLNAFLDVATKSVSTDQNLSINDLRNLALRLRHLDPAHVQFATLPLTDINGTRDGQSVVLLDQQALPGFFHSLDAAAPKPAEGQSATLTVPPGDIQVVVLNGNGTSGLASSTAQKMADQGFGIAGTGNATHVDRTTVFYGKDADRAAAQTVAAATGARVVQDSSVTGSLRLVLGSDFSKVTTVHVGGPAAGSSTPGPSPSAGSSTPQTTTAANDPCGKTS